MCYTSWAKQYHKGDRGYLVASSPGSPSCTEIKFNLCTNRSILQWGSKVNAHIEAVDKATCIWLHNQQGSSQGALSKIHCCIFFALQGFSTFFDICTCKLDIHDIVCMCYCTCVVYACPFLEIGLHTIYTCSLGTRGLGRGNHFNVEIEP